MTLDDILDDDISDLIGGAPRERKPLPTNFKPIEDRLFTEPCSKCRGSGQFIGYTGRVFGQCFACKGKGTFTFKSSPEQRAKSRASSTTRKAEATFAWCEEHKAEVAWIAETARKNAERGGSFTFPAAMQESLIKFGSLTDGQLGAVRKCMARNAARASEAQKAKDAAPAIDASKITAAFDNARQAAQRDGEGIMDLRLRLDTFVFSPSRDGDGSIWIKDKVEKTWVGKIVAGKFERFRACTDDQQVRIIAAAADPAAAARAFGQRFTSCSCCGRTLTNKISRDLGIGPICRDKWGF